MSLCIWEDANQLLLMFLAGGVFHLLVIISRSQNLSEIQNKDENGELMHPHMLSFTCVVSNAVAEFWGAGGLTQSFVRSQGTWKKWEDAIINEGITSLESRCFWQCVRLSRISLPDSLTALKFSSLQETAIVTIQIPKSVTTIEAQVWNSVESLTHITVSPENSVYSSDGVSLYKGTVMVCIPVQCTSITIREDTTEMFADCGRWSHAGEVVIPNNVMTINSGAFRGCWMTKLVIGRSVSNIHVNAFNGCANLTEMKVVDGNTVYSCVGGVFKTSTCLMRVLTGTSITIGSGITSVSTACLCLCTELVSVSVDPANSVFSAPSSGQYLLSGTTVVSGVGGRREITIGGDVTCINTDAFFTNLKLEKVIFEEGTAQLVIQGNAFGTTRSLKTLEFKRTNIVLDGAAFGGADLSEFTALPSHITTLSNVFGASNIRKLTLLGVTALYDSAFLKCRCLEEISMPKLVTMGFGTFEQCFSLRKVDFGSAGVLTTIGDLSFTRCESLESITIPGSVTTLTASIFGDTPRLTSILIEESSNYVSVDGVIYTSDLSTLQCILRMREFGNDSNLSECQLHRE